MPNLEYEVAPGPSIIDLIWQELDESYAELMKLMGSKMPGPADAIQQLRGRCAGLAVAIAIMRNPYDPDDDVIRLEAQERWEASQ